MACGHIRHRLANQKQTQNLQILEGANPLMSFSVGAIMQTSPMRHQQSIIIHSATKSWKRDLSLSLSLPSLFPPPYFTLLQFHSAAFHNNSILQQYSNIACFTVQVSVVSLHLFVCFLIGISVILNIK